MGGRPPRFLFICAKRQPATPIRKLRLAPSSGLTSNNAKQSSAIGQFGCNPQDQSEEPGARSLQPSLPTSVFGTF